MVLFLVLTSTKLQHVDNTNDSKYSSKTDVDAQALKCPTPLRMPLPDP